MRKYALSTLCFCLVAAGSIVPTHGTIKQCLLWKGADPASCAGPEGEERCKKFCQYFNNNRVISAGKMSRRWLKDCAGLKPGCECSCKTRSVRMISINKF